jgi:hypothetical protein
VHGQPGREPKSHQRQRALDGARSDYSVGPWAKQRHLVGGRHRHRDGHGQASLARVLKQPCSFVPRGHEQNSPAHAPPPLALVRAVLMPVSSD